MAVPFKGKGSFTSAIPVLVVPNTPYNTNVPFLMGTNFLTKVPSDHSTMDSLSSSVQKAITCLQQTAKFLKNSDGIFGEVIASSNLTIPPHSGVLSYG